MGYDIGRVNSWSLEWEFGERIVHDHINIQALGSDDRAMDDTTINVTSAETEDGSGP